ncbi:MAG: ABC transporter substrate-binding protein [Egibacteraceae bacterium]
MDAHAAGGRGVHDGSAFDAEDVAATLAWVLDEANGSGYRRFIATVSDIEVADPRTVTLTTAIPDALLADYLVQVPDAARVPVPVAAAGPRRGAGRLRHDARAHARAGRHSAGVLARPRRSPIGQASARMRAEAWPYAVSWPLTLVGMTHSEDVALKDCTELLARRAQATTASSRAEPR